MSRQLWEGAETKISAGPLRVWPFELALEPLKTGPDMLNSCCESLSDPHTQVFIGWYKFRQARYASEPAELNQMSAGPLRV